MFRRATSMQTRLALLGLALLGCPRPSTVSEPSEPTEPTEPDEVASDPAPSCSDERFADYEWVPDDTRLATSIQRNDPELSAALAVVARMSETPELQLPVSTALDFRNLGLQLRTLDRVLETLELAPAELVELQSPSGEYVWIWATDCPPPAIAARFLDRYGVMLRAEMERPGLRHGDGSVDFPFDVVTLGEHRVALTLMGRGANVGAWLHAAMTRGEGTRGEGASDEGPGRVLAEIPAAPIRTVIAGEALLTSASGPTPPRLRRLQVTGTAWNES